jgi:hypothetical protein
MIAPMTADRNVRNLPHQSTSITKSAWSDAGFPRAPPQPARTAVLSLLQSQPLPVHNEVRLTTYTGSVSECRAGGQDGHVMRKFGVAAQSANLIPSSHRKIF